MSEQIYNPSDTICAVSTAPGVGGIAVIRLSGRQAIEIADKVWQGRALAAATSHTAHLGNIVDADGETLDQAVALVFRGPRSYTGEDTVEFSVHGSRWIQRAVLQALVRAGARIALPGEYTRRAYAAGNLDLAQAEAVADLIAAGSRGAHRAAMSQMRGKVSGRLAELREQLLHFASLIELELDFSDQDVEFVPREDLVGLARGIEAEIERLLKSFETGAAVKNGFPIAIIGPVNAGKSALLNAILDDDRAIVSDIPGTTRDVVEDWREVGDYLIRFLDTAGLRSTDDAIERIGIERSRRAAADAAVVINLIDAADPQPLEAGIEDSRLIVAVNKADIADAETIAAKLRSEGHDAVAISALRGQGIDNLLKAIEKKLTAKVDSDACDDILITAARHAEALRSALASTRAAIAAIRAGIPTDLVAQDLRETLHHLSAITGAITTPEILNTIFTRFCIGK